MYVIGMNGPPRCGKNTIAQALADRLDKLTDKPVQLMSLGEPMGRCAAGLLGAIYSEEWYEREKDRVQSVLGVTLRQFIIQLSEKFMKPEFGRDIWMDLFIEAIPDDLVRADGIVIIVNFGFPHEPQFIECRLFDSKQLLTVQIQREGKDYSNDSRSYVASTHNLSVMHHENGTSEAAEVILERLRQLDWPIGRDLLHIAT